MRNLRVDQFGDIHFRLYLLDKAQDRTALAEQALATSEKLRKLELKNQAARLARAVEAAKQDGQRKPSSSP